VINSRSDICELAGWWARHPSDYVRPDDDDWEPVPFDLEPFSDPRSFAWWVNDGGASSPGRDMNCADCARAFELCWRGKPQISAALPPEHEGESPEQIESWLGRRLEDHTFESIRERLASAGHGASAYIVVWWKEGGGRVAGGHAFNAVNWDGEVYWIDAQPDTAIIEVWPPRAFPYSSEGYDESEVAETIAALFDKDGSAL
jgi:CubicO group peptidase (beta-lactamase class C family)